jgi:hypothetical protein
MAQIVLHPKTFAGVLLDNPFACGYTHDVWGVAACFPAGFVVVIPLARFASHRRFMRLNTLARPSRRLWWSRFNFTGTPILRLGKKHLFQEFPNGT